MTKPKIPMEEGLWPAESFLGFGHWGLGFDWDLAPWSLGFGPLASGLGF
jgi:hypothetical protein